jgi:hypothetical protein
MSVEPLRDLIASHRPVLVDRRTPFFVKRRSDESEPAAPEHVAQLISVEYFAPGRRNDVSQAGFHCVVNMRERVTCAAAEDVTEHGVGRFVSPVHSFDDVVATVLVVQTQHVVDVEEEDRQQVVVIHSLGPFQVLAPMQAVRSDCKSARAWWRPSPRFGRFSYSGKLVNSVSRQATLAVAGFMEGIEDKGFSLPASQHRHVCKKVAGVPPKQPAGGGRVGYFRRFRRSK